MNARRASFLIALCMATMTTCAQTTASDSATTTRIDVPHRQILVMLRAAPPHFRPDSNYSPGYQAQIGQGAQRRIAEDVAQRHALRLVAAWPMPALGIDCFVLEAQSGEAVAHVVEEIARDTRVESAQAMNVFHVLAHDDPLYPLQPSARLWHLAEVHKIATGRNVRIAEVDTGVEADHPDLRGRVAVARNFAETPAATGEAHGTAVAGIIAARADDGIGIAGVAPEAMLFALRACRQPNPEATATCTTFSLAKALQFALDQDIQVINLSLGGPRDRLLERLLDAALARHIVVVGAIDARVDGGGFPASHPGVLAVAGEAGSLPSGALLAPGRDVPTTTPGRTWSFVSGASYAAAHVSGVVALLLERAPTMDPQQVRSVLASGGPNAVLDGPAMVDACSALARTTGACVCGCVVAHEVNSSLSH